MAASLNAVILSAAFRSGLFEIVMTAREMRHTNPAMAMVGITGDLLNLP